MGVWINLLDGYYMVYLGFEHTTKPVILRPMLFDSNTIFVLPIRPLVYYMTERK